MGTHPINLAVRFILELIALGSFAYWGWTHFSGWPHILMAVLLPVLAAAVWGIFAVPDDPSRSGQTVVATSGIIRLVLETAFFSASTVIILSSKLVGIGFGVITFAHYAISYDRVVWLLHH